MLPKAEHHERVRAVVGAAPEELRDWTPVRLQEANRKSFRDALAELIDALGRTPQRDDSELFTEKVRITRNYLTHWTKSLEPNAARGQELMGLTWALRSVLEALLLAEVGFSADEAGALPETQRGLQARLQLRLRDAQAVFEQPELE